MPSDIKVSNVKKYFKDVKAVDDVSITIGEGQFVALLGPNGAGKTTLVEMIEGIQQPDSGEISIKGLSWKNNSNELHKILGISFQETKFFDKLTVYETLKLFASFYRLDNKRINEILEIINLTEKSKAYVVNLSGGQRQKLAIGIAIINKPHILLLDEPTTGLDPTARREIWSILTNLKQVQKTSLVLTTHYMEEAENLCEYVIIMHKGKIITEGTLDQLFMKNNATDIIEFTYGNEGALDVDQINIPGCRIEFENNTKKAKLIFSDGKTSQHLHELLDIINNKNINLKSLSCTKTNLEDLFISLTGRTLHD